MTPTSPHGRPAIAARATHACATLVLLAAAVGLMRSNPGPVHSALALAAVALAVGSAWRATRPDPGLAEGLAVLGGGLLAAATAASTAHVGAWPRALYAASVLAWAASLAVRHRTAPTGPPLAHGHMHTGSSGDQRSPAPDDGRP